MHPTTTALRVFAVLVLAYVSLLASSPAHAQRPDFQIAVSPKEASLGDTVTVTVTVKLPGLTGPERYWPPETSSFKAVDSQIKKGTQSSLDPSLGQQLTTVEVYRYVLQPLSAGRLLLGPAKIRVAGQEWETRQIAVRIRATGGQGKAAGIGHTDASGLDAPGYLAPVGEHPDVFLHAVVDKRSAWVGEQFTVSWLLFARTEVLKYEPTPPRLTGLWSETLFEPTAFFRYSDARIGTKDYVVAMVSKRAFFATSSGPLTVAPLQAQIATVSTALGRAETIASNVLKLTIKALPTPTPANFDASYVGQFDVAATVDRDLLQAGQALTLSLRVRGKGALARTSAPRLRFPGFTFEQPRDFESRASNQGNLVAGQRLYRYWTTPTATGEQTIPAIELPYFDPSDGTYKVARSVAIGLTIEGELSDKSGSKIGTGSTIQKDIRLLRNTAQIKSRVLVDLYRQSWFWWLLAVPPLGFVGVVAGDRFRRRLRKETPRARLRRARGKARSHLKVADIHLRGQRPAKFFAALSRAIYSHLGEWLDQNLQSMTQKELQAFLSKRGFDGPTIRHIVDDLESFDKARFAPSAADEKQMRAAVERTKALFDRIEKTDLAQDRDEGQL